jgi:hypothetical protein
MTQPESAFGCIENMRAGRKKSGLRTKAAEVSLQVAVTFDQQGGGKFNTVPMFIVTPLPAVGAPAPPSYGPCLP